MDDLPTRRLLDAGDVDALAGAVHRLLAEVAELSARVARLEGWDGRDLDESELVSRALHPFLSG